MRKRFFFIASAWEIKNSIYFFAILTVKFQSEKRMLDLLNCLLLDLLIVLP